jgi:hypothetical protein
MNNEDEQFAPGPEERKLHNRMIYQITGRWPRTVVDERLRMANEHRYPNIERYIEAWNRDRARP